MEGLEGGAKPLQDAIDALYDQYANDLDLNESDLAKARQNILMMQRIFNDFAIKPWSPYDQSENVSLESLEKRSRKRYCVTVKWSLKAVVTSVEYCLS